MIFLWIVITPVTTEKSSRNELGNNTRHSNVAGIYIGSKLQLNCAYASKNIIKAVMCLIR